MDLNFHSVFKVAETDIAEKVEPVISKFLGELEAALKDLGFSHTSSVLTSDQGQKPIVPAPVEAAPEPAPTPAPTPEPVPTPVVEAPAEPAAPVTDDTPPLAPEPEDPEEPDPDNPTTDTPPAPPLS